MSEQEKVPLEAHAGTEINGEAEVIKAPTAEARSSRLALVLALVALLAVMAGLFMGYRYWYGMKQSLEQLESSLSQANQDQTETSERLAQTYQAFQQQQQKLAAQDLQLSEQRQQLRQEREAIHQQGVQLNRSLSQMQQRLGGKVSQWQVAEAEYLIRVANHRLALMGDAETAQAALSSADERLRDTGDPGWDGTREVLAQEIAALATVPEVDRSGLNSRLSALLELVDQLPLEEEGVRLETEAADLAEKSTDDPQSAFEMQRVLQDLWQGFKSMMVIRHHDRPISAMLPPEQRYFLVQNLRLKLEGAKTALMGSNAPFYRDSLLSSAEWVEYYFAPASPQVQAFLEQLAELAAEDIAPELPDISASLRALQSRRGELNQGISE